MLHAGIDLGGTKIEIRVLDHGGKQQYVKRIATPQGQYEATIEAICELVLAAENELDDRLTLGVGIPGATDPQTGKIKNANSTCLIGQRLDQDLATRLDRNVLLRNDADCFTLSEAIDGAATGADLVFGIIIGTGVGGGIVAHQRLLSGPNAICGEWGHNPLPWQRPGDLLLPCFCGKQGCIETFISGPGLCQHYELVSGQHFNRVEDILQRREQGDPLAQQLIEQFFDQLARSLASVINLLDPDAIVVGGGLSNMDLIYQEIPKRWSDYVLSENVNTQLLQAKYGDSSGARGAAWLGAQSILR